MKQHIDIGFATFIHIGQQAEEEEEEEEEEWPILSTNLKVVFSQSPLRQGMIG